MEDSLSVVEAPMRPRRRHSLEFKRRVVQESFAAGASIAGVALTHGINANLLHTWRWQYRRDVAAGIVSETGLVPVHLTSAPKGVCVDSRDTHPGAGRIEIIFESARVVIDGAADIKILRDVLDLLRA